MDAAGASRATVGDGRPRPASEATAFLDASPRAVLGFEDFADSLAFLTSRERDRLKLAGDEIIDNLVRHASPLEEGRLTVRAARRGRRIVLGIYFRSPKFAAFAAQCSDPEPLFDPAHRRWRGIGMVMCRNLSLAMRLKPGPALDRIFLEFASESERPTPPEPRPGTAAPQPAPAERIAASKQKREAAEPRSAPTETRRTAAEPARLPSLSSGRLRLVEK